MLNVVRMPSCSFMDYNTYITWKHLEKTLDPLSRFAQKYAFDPLTIKEKLAFNLLHLDMF